MSEEKIKKENKETESPNNNEQTYWLDDPKNIKKLIWFLAVICIALAVVDFAPFFGKHLYHPHASFGKGIFDLEIKIPNFYGFFGFISCVVFVYIAKLTRKILMRKEDYYDR